MPCYFPRFGYRDRDNRIRLGKAPPGEHQLDLPCQECIGCQRTKARDWAIRCHLESQQHDYSVFTTLTYREESVPWTLSPYHLSTFMKKLRQRVRRQFGKDRRLRYFASGEYGPRTHRPHYHALVFGADPSMAGIIEAAWGLGHCRTEEISARRIAYVAGYAAKQTGWKQRARTCDPETGELWQPPFIIMSRGGRHGKGIGAHARQWTSSWRKSAIYAGHEVPVPRYLHEAWKQTATPEQQEELNRELDALTRYTAEQLKAAHKIALAKQRQTDDLRRL